MWRPLFFSPSSVRTYRRYRNASVALNSKIIEEMGEEVNLIGAVAKLGKGRGIELEESEMGIICDYALYEMRRDGQNAVEEYQQTVGASGSLERELLQAMVKAQTGVFRAVEAVPARGEVMLEGLGEAPQCLTLTDLGLSQSIECPMLLFFRPIALPEVTMTSGFCFAFPPSEERTVRRRLEKCEGRGPGARFVEFFQLSRKKGVPAEFL